jgi:hypothetical protein
MMMNAYEEEKDGGVTGAVAAVEAWDASVFRIVGPTRAVCWVGPRVEGGGSGGVVEVEVVGGSSSKASFSFLDMALGAHALAPRPVRLSAPFLWNPEGGVFQVGGLKPFRSSMDINE